MTNTMSTNSQERRTTGARFFTSHQLVALLAASLVLTGCKTSRDLDQQAGIAAAAARAQDGAPSPRVAPANQAVIGKKPTQSSATASAANAANAAAPQAQSPAPPEANSGDRLLLREGDTLRITFPGAANLNSAAVIRRDGKITLPLVGEVHAAGLAPTDLEQRLLDLYGPQLQSKEVTVSLDSSAFPIYVTGAVLRPGKVVSDRPLSALEAVMEAGGFAYGRADMKNVRVIRYVKGEPQYHTLNLKAAMRGKDNSPFTLKPADILYVPERFTWF